MATMTPFGGPKYHKNADRGGQRNPCAFCGKEVTDKDGAVAIGVTDGGARFFKAEDCEAEEKKNPAGFMGIHQLGSDCARKLKAQQPELFGHQMSKAQKLALRERSLTAALVVALSSKAMARKIVNALTSEAAGKISASLINHGFPKANEALWDAIGQKEVE